MGLTSTGYLEDGYPHGTLVGYQRGCVGNSCRGKKDVGISCLGVHTRYVADWPFRKSINMGVSAAEIIALEKIAAQKPKKVVVKVVRKARVRRTDYGVKTPRNLVVTDDQVIGNCGQYGRSPSPANHGTPGGFRRGCRVDCPSEFSCSEANRAYRRENYRKNRDLKVGSHA